ncbi:hypothetical protein H7J07_10705 [Mycobacterium koreense]|uniref:Uncharacterized protein n=1 Tax=Mycolicibacillus koreensis TaxID=1069220 RepID=A0A7I7SFE6_9MYCO|nr:hypothetical protein [Mycolicibacillus koreensis]MCV7248682.1 hypothetical protein [Mycolicibacillus koreensis]OSC31157.1 hypothetical protein B8W67_16525 [Mycolicibacillus koreensis]BBY55644.1 membrane protein [Mycolicibacillus koreensis]
MRLAPTRNGLRVAVFDIAAPVGIAAGLLGIGAVLAWPRWWVAVCSVLLVLLVQAVAVNGWLWRRDAVTVGTDDDRPGLRLAVVAVAAAALVAALAVGYTRWTVPDRAFTADSAQVVAVAAEVAEATSSFSPRDPDAAADKAAALMVPERADLLRQDLATVAETMIHDKVTIRAVTLSAGLEALSATAASATVLVSSTRTAAGESPQRRVLALRVALTKLAGADTAVHDGWRVVDVAPLHTR